MITNSQMRDYERTVNAIYSGATLKSELSLSAWRDRTRQTVQCVTVLHDQLKIEFEAERDRYSTKENQKRLQEMEEGMRIFKDIARGKIEKDLNNVLAAKRAAFSKAMSAPDEAAVRLLQTLRMRESISASEIAATAEHLSGNLQALSVLAEIAKRNDVVFPKLNTDFYSTEQELKDAAGRLLNNIFDDSNYMTKLFLSENSTGGQMAPFIRALDNPGYLDVSQISDAPKTDSEKINDTVRDTVRDAVAEGLAFAVHEIENSWETGTDEPAD